MNDLQRIADMLLLAGPGLEQEGGDAGIARPALIGIVTRRPHALDLHRAVPVRGGGYRAAIGAEANQSGAGAEPTPRQLTNVVLTPDLAHLGKFGIADM